MDDCAICGQSNLQPQSYRKNMLHNGINLSAEGLQCHYCPDCEVEITSPEQIDHNAEIVRNAFVAARER